MKSIVVKWKDAPKSSTGYQSRRMMGAAESGCCRQGGSPCSAKKF